MKYFAIRKVEGYAGRLFSLYDLSDEDPDSEEELLSEFDKVILSWKNDASLIRLLEDDKEALQARGLDFEMVCQKCREELSQLIANLKDFATQGNFDPLLRNFHDGKNKSKNKRLDYGVSEREALQKVYPMPVAVFEEKFRNHEIVEFRYSYIRLYALRFSHDLLVILGGVIKVEETLQDSDSLARAKEYYEKITQRIEKSRGVAFSLRNEGEFYSF